MGLVGFVVAMSLVGFVVAMGLVGFVVAIGMVGSGSILGSTCVHHGPCAHPACGASARTGRNDEADWIM